MKNNSVLTKTFTLFLIVLIAISISGCIPPRPPASSSNAKDSAANEQATENGAGHDGSPSEIAELILQLVADQNYQELQRFVARQQISADLQEITGGRGDFQKFTSHADKKVAALVANSLSRFDIGSLRVDSELVNGNRATISLQGTQQGQLSRQELYMVREDGTWKLVPSHR
ncbi:MAG TPA: hypothetical protein PKD64_14965 [Pirellulaceae bacterium]|nr:hypothetical protein [Pirellulaceae bacterium]HMO93484.1 hypothetical protein [Pirellulaceae bacterium]HMP69201.1 hypothetical protein [Pirellulaceae bacterium]